MKDLFKVFNDDLERCKTGKDCMKPVGEEILEKNPPVGEIEMTNKINSMILKHKELGFSTKGISDKWHTFGELYYHRMILFLAIQKAHIDKAWKSKQHHDRTMFDDSFIVGIETPEGQYTYHYDLKYWDAFKDIRELEYAPEYDGHKPEDITRLLSL